MEPSEYLLGVDRLAARYTFGGRIDRGIQLRAFGIVELITRIDDVQVHPRTFGKIRRLIED
jgi:hypothetical protein